MLWTYLGLTLIGLVAVQLGLNVISAVQRVRAETARRALEMAQLQEELAAARARHRRLAEDPLPWNGFRKFVVSRKITESSSVCSFHLKPHDARPLPAFKPGQYLTFRLPGTHGKSQLIRCYSLSDRAHQGYYRVSVKRVPAAGPGAATVGLSSGMFHDVIQEGDLLDLRAPLGNFCLDPSEADPVVLIGAGIGVTPVYCMLATLAHQKSRRPIWFFYGVRNGRERLFATELETLVRDIPNINLRLCYSQPEAGARLGEDYHIHGRISPELLQRELPSSNFRFYYCGPGPMMEALTNGLKTWGVPESHLHFEAFGPMSLKRAGLAQPAAASTPTAPPLVTFRKSACSLPWDGTHATLLDLAEHAGIVIASGCRAGNCGTCVVAMQWGEVAYIQPPGSPPEARTCLTCIAQPKGDVVLEA